MELHEQRNNERAQAEQFFQESAYDYDVNVDGKSVFNQLLTYDYSVEGFTLLFLVVFFRVLPK